MYTRLVYEALAVCRLCPPHCVKQRNNRCRLNLVVTESIKSAHGFLCPPELMSCVNREVGRGSHFLSHYPSPVSNKPYGFSGRKRSWRRRKKREDLFQSSELRSCENREVVLGSHSLPHSSSVPNKPYGFCGRKAPLKKPLSSASSSWGWIPLTQRLRPSPPLPPTRTRPHCREPRVVNIKVVKLLAFEFKAWTGPCVLRLLSGIVSL